MKRNKAVARRLIAGATGVLLIAVLGVGSAAATYRLSNGTAVSAGGRISNNCYTLLSTIGEPAAGTVGSGSYQLTAGFGGINSGSLSGDRIFQNGFDGPKDCTQ